MVKPSALAFALFVSLGGAALALGVWYGVKTFSTALAHGEVVLAKAPLVLSATPTVLIAPPDTRVQSAYDARVCVVVAGGAPGNGMEQRKDDLLAGRTVAATIEMDNGKRYELKNPGTAWSEPGAIVPHGELAACVSVINTAAAFQTPQKGEMVTSVSLVASAPLPVLGVYWTSKPYPPERRRDGNRLTLVPDGTAQPAPNPRACASSIRRDATAAPLRPEEASHPRPRVIPASAGKPSQTLNPSLGRLTWCRCVARA